MQLILSQSLDRRHEATVLACMSSKPRSFTAQEAAFAFKYGGAHMRRSRVEDCYTYRRERGQGVRYARQCRWV